ncbi:hypothetical protein BD309DRAFT_878995 [Dichomitus squalens]|uniref:Uncharacterized protein n=1 Tax=Dichomitus squalens TaxID=114155 RepID=A0A4V6MW56_9APHY|nr:hypothetical protein BD309DRAFT_878995 [Dichomitus squalens]TBU52198.1 hypothetical protein BD310DRAFT_832758 [Dichomitus squalens]
MDPIHFVRGLVANGPPYPDDAPRAVVDFLTAMDAALPMRENAPYNDVSVVPSDYRVKYFLDAFEIFPSPPPIPDAPPRKLLTYSLLRLALFCARGASLLHRAEDENTNILDDESASALFYELQDRIEEVCDRLSNASTLGDLFENLCVSIARPPRRPPPIPMSDSVITASPKTRKSKTKTTRKARKPAPVGPLPTFRSAGWGRTESSAAASPTQKRPSRPPAPISKSPWDDFSTSSSGFSLSRSF